MRDKILHWFATGRVGASSKAMANAACGLPQDPLWGPSYPHDPDDLNRCLLLLAVAPEIRHNWDKIAALSPTWSRLVERWDEIEASFLEEVGLNWCKASSAPKTYDLMQSILRPTK